MSIDQCNAWGEKLSEEFEFGTLLMDDVYQLNDFINKLSENLFLTGLDCQLTIAMRGKEFKLEALYLEIQMMKLSEILFFAGFNCQLTIDYCNERGKILRKIQIGGISSSY